MYSNTRATQLLINHYNKGTNMVSNEVLKYNSHKVRHSIGVLELGRNLLAKIEENSNINNETISRAEIIFILHDIGRFYQNNIDAILSEDHFDHGDYGFELLKNENYDNQILLGIKYHNKININGLLEDELFNQMNDHEKQETLFLTKLIRDADKLQNMIYSIFNFNEYFNLGDKKFPYGDIGEKIIEKIKIGEIILYSDTNTFGERLILYYCRKFNLNFQESMNMLDYYNFDEKYYNFIKNTNGISDKSLKEIKKYVYNYKNIKN
ncbi:MAG: HD domain-containing protein [Candidatus Absconditabacteria bacterium]